MDHLIRNHDINAGKCIFNINSPERLIQRISSYDAVVSCRLHPSIISFSLDVPSIGIVWNSKVKYFYDSIGYMNRVMETKTITAEKLVKRVEESIEQGIEKNEEYLMSVYNALFSSIREIIAPAHSTVMPYTFTELIENMPVYKGTSEQEQEEKLKRKFRRAYEKYNQASTTKPQRSKGIFERAKEKGIKGTFKYFMKKLGFRD